MSTLPSKENFSKEQIYSRMLSEAARIWKYDESEIDAFDPLVKLLIGSLAKELQKFHNELNNTQSRLLERLSKILLPEVLTGPSPAHAVMRARPEEATFIIDRDNAQLYTRKDLSHLRASAQPDTEVFLSPTKAFKLFNAGVQFLVSGTTVHEMPSPTSKQMVLESLQGASLDHCTLWLGLDIGEGVRELEDLNFFFDWKNEPELQHFLQLLPTVQWKLNGEDLPVGVGLKIVEEQQEEALTLKSFFGNFDQAINAENEANAYYDPHFLHLPATEGVIKNSIHHLKRAYPQAFEPVFDEKALQGIFKKELLWLELRFPNEPFIQEALSKVYCSINCFPVINRRRHQPSFRLQENLNIVPVKTEDQLFNIESVYDVNGDRYTPLDNLLDFKKKKSGGYLLRQKGMGRFDSRDASEMLDYLLDLLKDESIAFSSLLDRDWINSELKNINQSIARLETEMSGPILSETASYLMLSPLSEADTTVYLKYWSTKGSWANGIPANNPVHIYEGADFREANLNLVLSTTGGSDRLKPTESLPAFKKALLSKKRIVTPEDIYMLVYQIFGKGCLRHIEVKRGIMVGRKPKQGLLRTVDVHLYPTEASLTTTEEWRAKLRTLQVNLDRRSVGICPHRIIVA